MVDKIASTDAWRVRADDDPWYAVASHAGTEGNKWNRDAFYELGRQDWADFLAQWLTYAVPNGTCVEIGCGAGRMTKHLAGHFDRTIATEVSDTMIDLAREVAPTADIRKVDGALVPVDTDSVDAVFTVHVLQHFESAEDVLTVLREAKRVLRPGGTTMIHLLVRTADESSLTYRLREIKRDTVRRFRPGTTARRYTPDEVRSMFDAAGFHRVEMRQFRVTSNNDPHAFWFATA